MNIFAVDNNPYAAAISLCDRHVIKMVFETAQMLSTILPGDGMYKPTHKNHPCTLWAAEDESNLVWLINHGLSLGKEYTYRYGKIHASVAIIQRVADSVKMDSRWRKHTPFAQVMPEQYRQENAVEAYRAFYRGEKRAFATWKHPAGKPDWFDV